MKCQQRSALCLLAILDMKPNDVWADARNPLIGITPIMEWARDNYRQKWAPNTRETIRRQTMHQFMAAGVALYNPDKPDRPVNSPAAVYQIEPTLRDVLRSYGSNRYQALLADYKRVRQSLTDRYAAEREMNMVPVQLMDGAEIKLSPGAHSALIKAIVEAFAARFVPGGKLIYVGDTGDKHSYYNIELLRSLKIDLDSHGKFPDVIIYYQDKNWLVLCESVTSHGPVDGKRRQELMALFGQSSAGLVFVSAFPDRRVFLKYLDVIAWETEVWIADSPTHMIHFNGERFLGPYA